MASQAHGPVRRQPIWTALAALVVLIAFVLPFDWNWARPPIERYISSKTERELRMSDLHVMLGVTPTIRIKDVYFSNAARAPRRTAARFSVKCRVPCARQADPPTRLQGGQQP
ncbi:hypothetical protein [Variovorax saccharolyticus]|uniref:hypothetical protein n=1 Tax=Variovorax saccharolyticus TaxID=3053516 RepID=UPI0025767819|nr:hypothetical protein [Variovorax sp. J22R187]MDM0022864.1 hypothetical protein [Variovorax sp. J22R187]